MISDISRLFSIVIALCIVVLPSAQGCYNRPAAPDNLRIIFTSDTRGCITPCGTHDGLKGGMARRSTAISNALESAPGPVILVDTGNFTTGSTDELELIKIDYVTQAMSELEYDAVNVGLMDARRDREVLLEISNHGVPLTSAGYTYTGEESGETEFSYPEKIIIERENFPVAIVGSHLSDTAADLPLGDENNATVSGFDLFEMIHDLYAIDGVAMVIVISDMADTWQQAHITASLFPLATVVIAGESAQPEFTEEKTGSEIDHPVTIPHAAEWGRSVGILDLELSRTGGVVSYKLEYFDLDEDIESDPEFTAMIDEYAAALSTAPADIRELDTTAYAGSEACMECHSAEYDHWTSTAHARAFLSLENTDAPDMPTCFPCHITGHTGLDWLPVDMVPRPLVNVGCEACHGPGLGHIAFRSGNVDTESESIILQPSEETCTACHIPPWDEAWLYRVKYDRIRHESD